MHLFDSFKIRDVEFRNRIAVSPMCEYSSEDGYANDWHLVHLGSRAVGGAGTVITEAISVLPEGRITPYDLGIWKDDHIEFLSRIVRFLKAHGAVTGTQLAHAGFKASTAQPWNGGGPVAVEDGGWRPIYSASDVPFSPDSIKPEALTPEGIARVANAFCEGARRTLDAGFELIEIHGAHGYLIHEFLSPLTNKRTDQYGGTFENRTRILREVIEAIRKVWPERLPLWLRISANDWAEGGWTPEDSVALGKMVKPMGVDLIDCSSGGILPTATGIPVGPGYQTPFAEKVRHEAGIMTGAVGMITSPAQAQHIIGTGQADVVLLARELLRDPYWPLQAAHALHKDVTWPKQYARAKMR